MLGLAFRIVSIANFSSSRSHLSFCVFCFLLLEAPFMVVVVTPKTFFMRTCLGSLLLKVPS